MMLEPLLTQFREIWVVDFEFNARRGERPQPLCLVAHEIRSRTTMRVWRDEMDSLRAPPYAVGDGALFVAYYASAELGCHLALAWPLPEHVLDLFAEFRMATNGLALHGGQGLLDALALFGLEGIALSQKEVMRDLVLRGGPYSALERTQILDYCESDVVATTKLLNAMAERLDTPRALLRGRYMKAAARMECAGTPVDMDQFKLIVTQWPSIRGALIDEIDKPYGAFANGSFGSVRWEAYLIREGIAWPRLPSGALALDDDTFKERALAFPQVDPMRQLRKTLAQMRDLSELAIGADGRNRTLLSVFRSKTGRNQPSNSRFIFGRPKWLRGLIEPTPGYGLAYLDWSQQEFGIAAALSGDAAMQEAYSSGDPYLAFAKQVGAVPSSATKASHAREREQFKACVLAVQYGMGEESLAKRINQPVARARELLQLHGRTYRTFWAWSDGAVSCALLSGRLWTVYGWPLHVTRETSVRTLRNFPMQANGAEMLRLACSMATEAGIVVCAPVHDAILIEAPLTSLDAAVEAAQAHMETASKHVLGGFALRSDAKIIRYPDRYLDESGAGMWDIVQKLLRESENVSQPVMA